MKRSFLQFLLISLSFVFSGSLLSAQGLWIKDQKKTVTKTVRHEGIERVFHVRLPVRLKKFERSPLVLVLHGGGGNGRKFDRSMTNGTLGVAADKKGVLLVFPEGVNQQWCDGRTEHLKTRRSYDDVGFISRVIDVMVQEYGVDAKRVYATGISNGGFMSVRLAIELSDKIAAVAPVTAQLSKAISHKIPTSPVAVMILNGTSDPLVPFSGGHVRLFRFGRNRGEVLPTYSTIEYFRNHNRCRSGPLKRRLPDRAPGDGTQIVLEEHSDCKDGASVVLAKIIGGGHTWPGGRQYLSPKMVGVVSRDLNASEVILDFFLKHSRPGVGK